MVVDEDCASHTMQKALARSGFIAEKGQGAYRKIKI
jgi:hypothetical protein